LSRPSVQSLISSSSFCLSSFGVHQHPNIGLYQSIPTRVCLTQRVIGLSDMSLVQCATYYSHMITATACNIASDIMLILLPIPIVINISLSRKRYVHSPVADTVTDRSRRVGLCCVFGLGLFNILAAVLNRYYNFSNPNSYVFLYW
jgi:hypothetical protein